MSWKNRYIFPTLNNVVGRKFEINPNSDKSLWDKTIIGDAKGVIYTCHNRTDNTVYLKEQCWSMSYEFLKEHFFVVN